MDATKTKVSALAKTAAQCFEAGVRENGDEFYSLTRTSPGWVNELMYKAHGDAFLPDDYRYKWAYLACVVIAESEDVDDGQHEFADSCVPVYTSERLQWLASNLNRPLYCDESFHEFGGDFEGIVELVGLGMYAEAHEVYGLVLAALEDQAKS